MPTSNEFQAGILHSAQDCYLHIFMLRYTYLSMLSIGGICVAHRPHFTFRGQTGRNDMKQVALTVWRSYVANMIAITLALTSFFYLVAKMPVEHAQALTNLGRQAFVAYGLVDLLLWVGAMAVTLALAALVRV